jgi:hypothetical protein
LKALIVYDKDGEKKYERTMRSTLIAKREDYVVYNLVVKNSRRMILMRGDMELWK